MPGAAWAVSGQSPKLISENGNPVLGSSDPLRTRISGSLALASVNLACRNSCSDFSATFTTIALDNSSLRWLEINTLLTRYMRRWVIERFFAWNGSVESSFAGSTTPRTSSACLVVLFRRF